MFAGHSMLCPTTARQTPHDEKCVLCGYQGKNGAGGTPGATREMRRMAHAEPSICGGHDVSCQYDGKKLLEFYFSDAAASSFSSGSSLAAALLPFFSFFFSSEPMNSRIASSAPSPILQPVRTILV